MRQVNNVERPLDNGAPLLPQEFRVESYELFELDVFDSQVVDQIGKDTLEDRSALIYEPY